MEFADFFEASWDPCLRAVMAVVGSPQLAEDQVAEAFARAFASWRKVGGHPAPRAWVVRTALNTGASWWHRRSRELPLTCCAPCLTPCPAFRWPGLRSWRQSRPGASPGSAGGALPA
jgi:DNA-directed RNA polymerase specialized sigma24 family protein